MLPCMHVMCLGCISSYAEFKVQSHELQCQELGHLSCPTCMAPIQDRQTVLKILRAGGQFNDVPGTAYTLVRAARMQAATAHQPTRTHRAVQDEAEARRMDEEFQNWARANHIKACPGCRVPIQKNGGCNNMICQSCSSPFQWRQQPLLCACRGYHLRGHPIFVKACKHTPKESMPFRRKAELQLSRAGLAVIYAPLVLPLAVAALVVGGPLLGAAYARTYARKHAQKLKRRKRHETLQRLQRLRAEEEYNRSLRNTCRVTGVHDFVAGWCTQCGYRTNSWYDRPATPTG